MGEQRCAHGSNRRSLRSLSGPNMKKFRPLAIECASNDADPSSFANRVLQAQRQSNGPSQFTFESITPRPVVSQWIESTDCRSFVAYEYLGPDILLQRSSTYSRYDHEAPRNSLSLGFNLEGQSCDNTYKSIVNICDSSATAIHTPALEEPIQFPPTAPCVSSSPETVEQSDILSAMDEGCAAASGQVPPSKHLYMNRKRPVTPCPKSACLQQGASMERPNTLLPTIRPILEKHSQIPRVETESKHNLTRNANEQVRLSSQLGKESDAPYNKAPSEGPSAARIRDAGMWRFGRRILNSRTTKNYSEVVCKDKETKQRPPTAPVPGSSINSLFNRCITRPNLLSIGSSIDVNRNSVRLEPIARPLEALSSSIQSGSQPKSLFESQNSSRRLSNSLRIDVTKPNVGIPKEELAQTPRVTVPTIRRRSSGRIEIKYFSEDFTLHEKMTGSIKQELPKLTPTPLSKPYGISLGGFPPPSTSPSHFVHNVPSKNDEYKDFDLQAMSGTSMKSACHSRSASFFPPGGELDYDQDTIFNSSSALNDSDAKVLSSAEIQALQRAQAEPIHEYPVWVLLAMVQALSEEIENTRIVVPSNIYKTYFSPTQPNGLTLKRFHSTDAGDLHFPTWHATNQDSCNGKQPIPPSTMENEILSPNRPTLDNSSVAEIYISASTTSCWFWLLGVRDILEDLKRRGYLWLYSQDATALEESYAECVTRIQKEHLSFAGILQEDFLVRLLHYVPLPNPTCQSLFLRCALAFVGWGKLNETTMTIMQLHLEAEMEERLRREMKVFFQSTRKIDDEAVEVDGKLVPIKGKEEELKKVLQMELEMELAAIEGALVEPLSAPCPQTQQRFTLSGVDMELFGWFVSIEEMRQRMLSTEQCQSRSEKEELAAALSGLRKCLRAPSQLPRTRPNFPFRSLNPCLSSSSTSASLSSENSSYDSIETEAAAETMLKNGSGLSAHGKSSPSLAFTNHAEWQMLRLKELYLGKCRSGAVIPVFSNPLLWKKLQELLEVTISTDNILRILSTNPDDLDAHFQFVHYSRSTCASIDPKVTWQQLGTSMVTSEYALDEGDGSIEVDADRDTAKNTESILLLESPIDCKHEMVKQESPTMCKNAQYSFPDPVASPIHCPKRCNTEGYTNPKMHMELTSLREKSRIQGLTEEIVSVMNTQLVQTALVMHHQRTTDNCWQLLLEQSPVACTSPLTGKSCGNGTPSPTGNPPSCSATTPSIVRHPFLDAFSPFSPKTLGFLGETPISPTFFSRTHSVDTDSSNENHSRHFPVVAANGLAALTAVDSKRRDYVVSADDEIDVVISMHPRKCKEPLLDPHTKKAMTFRASGPALEMDKVLASLTRTCRRHYIRRTGVFGGKKRLDLSTEDAGESWSSCNRHRKGQFTSSAQSFGTDRSQVSVYCCHAIRLFVRDYNLPSRYFDPIYPYNLCFSLIMWTISLLRLMAAIQCVVSF